jgi:DNA-binding MarR family transcriptional regulator
MTDTELEDLLDFFYRCPIGLIEVDRTGSVERINPAAVRLLAPADPADDLTNILGLAAKLSPRLHAALTSPNRVLTTPLRVRIAVRAAESSGPGEAGRAAAGESGHESWVELRTVPVHGDRVVLTVTDVTAEHRLTRHVDVLGNQLRDLVAATTAYRRAAATELNISTAAVAALEELINRGTRTPTALARWLDLSGTSVTAVIDQIEHRGFVTRTPHPDDRRSTLITLTAAGWDRAAPLLQLLVGGLDEVIDRAGDPADTRLAEALGVITSALRTGTPGSSRRSGP